MARVVHSDEDFTIVGENVHATRVLRRNGRRVVDLGDGVEAVPFKGESGEQRYLTIPESFKRTQPYQEGVIKHFSIAMMKGITDDPSEREEGRAYIRHAVGRQVKAGAKYIDINVDEVHYNLETQMKCMRWTVETVQEVSPVPPSVDSSKSEIIAEGLEAYDGKAGRPLLNSVAPERPETFDMAKEHDARVIVMATSGTGMPQDADERVENVHSIMEELRSKGLPLSAVFVDAIVFPISVDGRNGNNFLDAVRSIRKTYGDKIHVGMGMSNVSFGMPNRRLINETFIHLGLEAGVNAGLIDPVQMKLRRVLDLDTDSEPVRLAREMLLGDDEYCVNYIAAYREGRLG